MNARQHKRDITSRQHYRLKKPLPSRPSLRVIRTLAAADATLHAIDDVLASMRGERPYYYITDDAGAPVPCISVLAWAKWFETAKRHVADTEITEGNRVSTVFLGLDHNFMMQGPPVLWESMIFMENERHPLNQQMNRYTSREAALAGHDELVAEVRSALGIAP